MVLCVRKLDHKREWDDPQKNEPWLGANELRADALRDLETEDNRLSIWEVREGPGISLPRILAAVAAMRDNPTKLDFILFDFTILGELGIAHERLSGGTCDTEVNACHIDLIHLTAKQLSEFGARIRAARKAERYPDKKVMAFIQDSVDKKFLDPSRLKPKVSARIRISG